MTGEIVLTVPAQQAYVLIIRTALGGVALVNDLDVDTLDDLRQAADEACDLLLHQGACATSLRLEAHPQGRQLCVALSAQLEGSAPAPSAEESELSRAVLETLVPQVSLCTRADGLVERIELTVSRAAG